MRHVVGAVIVAAMVGGGLIAQEPTTKRKPVGVEGVWEGPLKVGPTELRLVFHVSKGKDDKLTATMDSIDQGAHGIPVPDVALTGRTLDLKLPPLKAKFTGTLVDADDKITGTWEQAGQKFPLELKRVEKPSTVKRPQHPKPPYPYATENVTFENSTAKFPLAGTLTLPQGDGPFPAVVLVSGSGPQDRDETLMGHKPFLVLADHLTRHGIAVLRYDDRGVGQSQGKHDGATSADFATDAYAAVTYLKSRKEVAPKRIGVMGHSEGGLIAPMVAADHPDDVAFLVLLAGPGIPGDEVLAGQQEAIATTMGATPEAIRLTRRLMDHLTRAAQEPGPVDARKQKLKKLFDEFVAGLSDDEKKLVTNGDATAVRAALADRMSDPWLQYFLTHDPRAVLRKVACPVLAVNGEFDLQVLHAANLAGIDKALKDGGNDRSTVKLFPGLNHLFQHTKTGKLSEYGQIDETFAPEALKYITEWVLKRK